MTPAQMRQRAREIRAAAEKEASQLEAAAAVVERYQQETAEIAATEERVLAGDDLTSADDSTNIHSTVQAPEDRKVAIGRARSRALRRRHPFVIALYSTKNGHIPETVVAWAERHDVPVASVASWIGTAANARKIPRRYADMIEKELGVPATLATWRNGITD